MAWIKVTGPGGNIVHASVDQLVSIRPPAPGEASPGAQSLIDFTNGHTQAAKESPDDIMIQLSGNGAQIAALGSEVHTEGLLQIPATSKGKAVKGKQRTKGKRR